METLFEKQRRYLAVTSTRIVRPIMNRINWNNRLISIRGARGIGKSYLLRQYAKMNYPVGSQKVLYCTADGIYFSTHSLIELATNFYQMGGVRLMIDEIHCYDNWSREIKEIYDLFPELKVVISGSSMLNIINADADLSRRCLPYEMHGLSFREYLRFYKDIDLPSYSLQEILSHSGEIAEDVCSKCRPLEHFKTYLKEGYYPFFDSNLDDYYISLENVVNYIVNQELPILGAVEPANCRKIKALLSVLASTGPFQVELTKLSAIIELSRPTTLTYLQLLERAGLLSLLYSDLLSVRKMQKPDKIYLQNTNLLYALSSDVPLVGTLRETFVLSQLADGHEVEYGRETGDFKVDGRYIFEVGGRRKSFSQIADIPDSYVLADDIEYPSGNKLPLWIVGFLY